MSSFPVLNIIYQFDSYSLRFFFKLLDLMKWALPLTNWQFTKQEALTQITAGHQKYASPISVLLTMCFSGLLIIGILPVCLISVRSQGQNQNNNIQFRKLQTNQFV